MKTEEDMKAIWLSIDERLKRQELLEKDRVRGMLYARSDKAISLFRRMELFNTIVCLVLIPILMWGLGQVIRIGEKVFPDIYLFVKYFFVFLVIAAGVTCCWSLYKLICLSRIDLADDICRNIRIIRGYHLKVKRELVVTFFLVPLLLAASIYIYANNANAMMWSYLICVYVIAIVVGIYGWFRIYKPKMALIMKSLEELKDLDEDTEA